MFRSASRPLAVASLALAGALALSACGGSKAADKPTPSSKTSSSPSAQSQSKIPEQKAPINKGAVAKAVKVGQKIDLGAVDGYKHLYLTVTKVSAKPTCYQKMPAPNYGRYASVSLSMSGVRGKGHAISPLLIEDWVATNAAGKRVEADWSRTVQCLSQTAMFPTTLSTGDMANGTLVFDIPKDTQTLTEQFTYSRPKPLNVVVKLH